MFNFPTGSKVADTSVDLTDNLVAHYLLNNNSNDNVGDSDGTDYSDVTYLGDVVKLGGSTDYIRTDLDGTIAGDFGVYGYLEFTMSLWVRPV